MKKVTRRVEKVKAEVLGLDVHQSMTAYCLLDRKGNEVASGRIPGDPKAMVELLDQVVGRKKSHVALEASGGSLWVYDLLVERYGTQRVHLAHARKVAAIANSRQKNDDNDAFWLAYLTYEGRLPESYMPEGERRELRIASRERRRCVEAIGDGKRLIRGALRQMGIVLPTKRFDTDASEKFLRTLAAITPGMRGRLLAAAIGRLDAQNEELRIWNHEIEELSKDLPEVGMLDRAIPGMGRTLAATVIAETGPLKRFHSPGALARFTGLTPVDRSTGGKSIHGHISREGSPHLRWALVQAVTLCMKMKRGAGGAVAAWVFAKEKRMGSRAKAKVAAARKFAEVMWRLAHYPEGFDAAKPFGGAPREEAVA
jgi:transposase